MKKLAGLLCALALLCSFCLPVFADNNDNTVTITTTVPSTHTITVAQAEGATVICNGQPGTSFTVDRLSQPQLLVRPESGRVLTRVLVNGVDVTSSVQGGYYTLPAVYEDLTIKVETDAATSVSGKRYIVQGTVTRNGAPVSGITLELRSTLKTCVTGSDGSFRFDDVETGHHTMTALENGKVVGYMAFYLTEDVTTHLSISGGAQVIHVDKSGIGVDLVLQLEDNGLLTPLQASTISAPVSTQTPAGEAPQAASPAQTTQSTTPPAQTTVPTFRIPQTGDAARPALLLVLALCSAVLFMLLWHKKGKE